MAPLYGGPCGNTRKGVPVLLNVQGATRQDLAYRMTRDGFMLLAMGFTGKEALR